eukprot:192432_1
MGNKASKVSTLNAKRSQDKKQQIKISVRMDCLDLPDVSGWNYNLGVIELNALYSPNEKIKDILQCALHQLRTKHYPLRFEIDQFEQDSFTGALILNENTLNTPITEWEREDIDYLALNVYIQYVHKIESNNITCCHMKKASSADPFKCPVYARMMNSYQWNEDNLKHITDYEHFECEVSEKTECKFNDDCYAYKRLEQGANGIKDLCHMKLFRHPPRKRQITLQENVHSFVVQTETNQKYQKVYQPTDDDKKQYERNELNGFLDALIEEVVSNGFKADLCLNDEDEKENNYSILSIVDNKMKCARHKAMGGFLNRAQMLSLILYTGCDCNYDLCASQRSGDYFKWKWFDYCLHSAIRVLSRTECGDFPVYSGLKNVKLHTKCKEYCFFATYVSASWSRNVAESFMSGTGMMFVIDNQFKDNDWVKCCDVSWISKFEDECEVLFQRGGDCSEQSFSCNVLDESKGIQTVALKNNGGCDGKFGFMSHVYL